ncbi:4Fe-4S dicluster domain-containing protein [Methanocaldococcus infernus]
MASSIFYIYEIVKRIKRVLDAKTKKEDYEDKPRFRKVPPIVKYPEKCISCEACKESCPAKAIEMVEREKKIPNIEVDSCIACLNCVEVCPTGVLELDKHRVSVEGQPFSVPKFHYLQIDEEVCANCGKCERACPIGVIHKTEKAYKIDVERCITCKRCLEVCPLKNAIVVFTEEEMNEKFDRAFKLKILKEFNKLTYEEKVEKPHIVKSLCIACLNCVEVCPGEIDIEKGEIISCLNCSYCLEVCPTTAIRVRKEPIAKEKVKCYVVLEEDCIGCRACYKVCKFGAITISKKTKLPYILPDKCIICGLCERECPVDTIKLVNIDEAKRMAKIRTIEDDLIERLENLLQGEMSEFAKKLCNLRGKC